jgi:cytochrome oxidase Cu insertion factor (SCO1/SenC/PrrC family)
MPSRRTIILAVSMLLVALATGLFALSVMKTPPVGSGTALIGGPFSLVDHTGKRVTDKDFKGRYMLVLFGYTFCPDVCPGEMQVVSAALDLLGADAQKIQPVFVAVDPARDTVEAVAGFVSNFHPSFRGLTGTEADVQTMVRNYRVVVRKIENKDRPEDYLVEHSLLIYLMDGDGKYVTHFSYGTDAKALAEEMRAALK